jgi:hypothetical protein
MLFQIPLKKKVGKIKPFLPLSYEFQYPFYRTRCRV